MWVEELSVDNIKCFDKINLKLGSKTEPYKWVTLLGENGGGKSTILQALGLLLAGPEGATQLLRPTGWLRNEDQYGRISTKIHKGANDPGKFGEQKARTSFGYSFLITGSKKITIRKKLYTEPSIVENKDKILTWLRQNALTSNGQGWFASGYGAFRRLTRSGRVIVPSLAPQERFNNFSSQFKEDEALSAFEQWMVYLDYRIAKGDSGSSKQAEKQRDLGVYAINQILPPGVKFDSVTDDARILFDIKGMKVATLNLSDGYRSVLALAGDLIWRLLDQFPESDDPLKEEGVVIIDELDIHLHPLWQRSIPDLLRSQFPNIQFIVATHSPLIAAGAGEDAITYRFTFNNGSTDVHQIRNIAYWNVDRILQSEAFGLVSPFSPQVEANIEKYYILKKKAKLTQAEKNELQTTLPFVENSIGYGDKEKSETEKKLDEYLKNHWK
ncbi:ATPase [Niastella koreensis]|uniref:ATPase n=2 Tax=Niastella koreensis TaxID=354356 RepID=G8TG56_NIAKG|nr:AAA family ATPase [Niastella koreensis]AEW01659.1 ATPase [Niastella koreensis GR20-10]OQP48370.1 ATPase [Niastella koreensis]